MSWVLVGKLSSGEAPFRVAALADILGETVASVEFEFAVFTAGLPLSTTLRALSGQGKTLGR